MAKKDGTISKDEDKRRHALMIRANSVSEKLFRSLKRSSKIIGGPFRSPGINAELRLIIKRNLEQYL